MKTASILMLNPLLALIAKYISGDISFEIKTQATRSQTGWLQPHWMSGKVRDCFESVIMAKIVIGLSGDIITLSDALLFVAIIDKQVFG